jgi:YlmC/YmxH family sporulation protein
MLHGFEELCRKEVIDIATGQRLGFIDDIELDIENGRVSSLVIYGGIRLFGLLGRGGDTVISCSDIRVVGEDVLLVELGERRTESKFTKNSTKGILSLLK